MISKPAPAWEGTSVLNGEFKELKLSDYLGKYLVFFFYPLDFTFVCPTEILAFNDRIKEFRAINTEVMIWNILNWSQIIILNICTNQSVNFIVSVHIWCSTSSLLKLFRFKLFSRYTELCKKNMEKLTYLVTDIGCSLQRGFPLHPPRVDEHPEGGGRTGQARHSPPLRSYPHHLKGIEVHPSFLCRIKSTKICKTL